MSSLREELLESLEIKKEDQLDTYDPDLLAEDVYEALSTEEKQVGEARIRRGNREEFCGDRRMISGLYGDEEEDKSTSKKGHLADIADIAGMDDEPMEEEGVERIENLENTEGTPVRDCVALGGLRRREVYRRACEDQKVTNLYQGKTCLICQKSKSRNILATECQVLAYFLPEDLTEVLEIFDKAANSFVLYVRIGELSLLEDLFSLRQLHLNQIICVNGVVSGCSGVLSQLSMFKLNRVKCGYVGGPFYQSQNRESKPETCLKCKSLGKPLQVEPCFNILFRSL